VSVTYANALVAAFELGGDLTLARTACDHYARAVQQVEPGSPNQVSYRCALASTWISIARATNDAGDVAVAVAAARLVWDGGAHVVLDRLRFALEYGRWALERFDYQEAAETFSRGLASMSNVLPSQLNRRDKEVWLKVAQTMPVLAACTHAALGRLRDAAVAVEAGRAVLLAEALYDGQGAIRSTTGPGHDVR
jgi:hypothetical protein